MRTFLPFFILLCIWSSQGQQIDIEPFASGFSRPLNIQHAGDSRLFVVEQGGMIKIVMPDGTVNPSAYLDISDRVSTGGERGLLGLTFHPDYQTNGHFYVNYTNPSGSTQISRFTVSNDPDRADVNSELQMITLEQPYSNHNGGCLAFGPDGYLYIALGDGGSGGDPQGRAQDISSLYGSLLRLDINAGLPYSIPADNPFVDQEGARAEIWAYGLRNPWKFSFDSTTSSLWIADVGQGAVEEINSVPTDQAGLNYGWRCYEGNSVYNTTDCPDAAGLTFPVASYPHENNRISITGGYVYRGSAFPALQGLYIFADFGSNEIGSLSSAGSSDFSITYTEPFAGMGFSSFGTDQNNELYVAALSTGTIYKIVDANALNIVKVDENGFSMYPNPAQETVHLTFSDKNPSAYISIFDILGKEILKKKVSSQKLQVDVSSLKKGIYLVQVQSATNSTKTEKLIIN